MAGLNSDTGENVVNMRQLVKILDVLSHNLEDDMLRHHFVISDETQEALNELRAFRHKAHYSEIMPILPSDELLDVGRRAGVPAVMLDSLSARERLELKARYKEMVLHVRRGNHNETL